MKEVTLDDPRDSILLLQKSREELLKELNVCMCQLTQIQKKEKSIRLRLDSYSAMIKDIKQKNNIPHVEF